MVVAIETKAPKQVEVNLSTFSGEKGKNAFAGSSKIREGVSEVYRNAYHNSEYWPIYGDKPGQELIPHSWGRQLALDVLSDPKGGAVFVARDNDGQVMGSLMAVNFASILDSHSSKVQPIIDTLKSQFGEKMLREMWYVIDVTIQPDTQKPKHSKGEIRPGVQQMGIGTKLFDEYEAFIKKKGAVGYIDWTSSENAPMREGMYAKIGITEMPGSHIGIEANVERNNSKTDPRWYEEGEKGARYAYKLFISAPSHLEGSLK